MSRSFTVSHRKTYLGPSIELDHQAIVLEMTDYDGIDASGLWPEIVRQLPELQNEAPPAGFPELFARAIIQVQQLGMDLFATKWSAREKDGRAIVAVQYVDGRTGELCVDFVEDWIRHILEGRSFRFKNRYEEIGYVFNKSSFGGPTIYSIIEAGYRAGLPMFYLKSEDVFQWGQGRKQLRGRSTVLHRDSIKDTELTMYKDRAKEFLDDLGFPVPRGTIVFNVSDAHKAAADIGYPVVTKPVAGHKGQGVTTGIQNPHEVEMGFQVARDASDNMADGIIVEKMVTGTDHRLLTVKGSFVAALQRIPAYVTGDGSHTIEQLIEIENDRPERADTPRSPLGKIKIDDNLVQFIRDKGLSLAAVPKSGEVVVLRRVANISAGGVSINVTDIIHPLNVKLAEDVAKFLNVHALGIDLLAEDISKPWTESPCSIIEINAGPGVFMHLVPAQGQSINVPDLILKAHFPTVNSARIPTLVFNRLDSDLAERLTAFALGKDGVEEVGAACEAGVFFNNRFFSKRPEQNCNIRNMMRNTQMDVALIEYCEQGIVSEGLYHWGADAVVLVDPTETERRTLTRDLLPGGIIVEADTGKKTLRVSSAEGKAKEQKLNGSLCKSLAQAVEPHLERFIQVYNVESAVHC
jgi:cyanophycin synthetase